MLNNNVLLGISSDEETGYCSIDRSQFFLFNKLMTPQTKVIPTYSYPSTKTNGNDLKHPDRTQSYPLPFKPTELK